VGALAVIVVVVLAVIWGTRRCRSGLIPTPRRR
jgi:hypothetical protein